MTFTIEQPTGAEALTEFLLFQDRINGQRQAWWPALVDMNLPTLQGRGAAAEGRRFLPLAARRDGEIVARVLGVIDQHYIDHWDDPLGHASLFEALPGSVDAVRALMNEVGAWFREHGLNAARAGFGHADFPFSIDSYDTLPPVLLRQNPSYYHTMLKESGFESERGWVDYKIEVTPDLVARWRGFLDDARRRGFEIVPLRDLSPELRVDDFNDAWNEAFAQHWGVAPQSRAERAELFETLGPFGMFDVSVIAYENGEPVGTLWVAPELASVMASTASGRVLRHDEKVNFLGIGVRERARSKGVNLAMAAYAYLGLVERGARYLSYTLVLDDNWPSRRTAEKLGGYVCANYMVYRRNFVRGA